MQETACTIYMLLYRKSSKYNIDYNTVKYASACFPINFFIQIKLYNLRLHSNFYMTMIENKEKNSEQKESSTSVITNSGTIVNLLLGPSNNVDIEDIATSLSNQCRFAGHTSKFYSIAEHSVYVALLAPVKLFQIYYLLHDAHEYLYQDITRPLKNIIDRSGMYRRLCNTCDVAIMKSFGLSYEKFINLHDEIKEADNELLRIEQEVFFHGRSSEELGDLHKLHGKKFGLKPEKAKELFLSMFNDLIK